MHRTPQPALMTPALERLGKSFALGGVLMTMSPHVQAVIAEAQAQERYYACAHAVGVSEGTARAILEQLVKLRRPLRAEADYDEARAHLYAGTMPVMAFERWVAQQLDMSPVDLEEVLLRLQTAMTSRGD